MTLHVQAGPELTWAAFWQMLNWVLSRAILMLQARCSRCVQYA